MAQTSSSVCVIFNLFCDRSNQTYERVTSFLLIARLTEKRDPGIDVVFNQMLCKLVLTFGSVFLCLMKSLGSALEMKASEHSVSFGAVYPTVKGGSNFIANENR